MLYFLLGLIAGGVMGIFVMCLLQINRDASEDLFETEDEFEKSAPAGVDNTAKKA